MSSSNLRIVSPDRLKGLLSVDLSCVVNSVALVGPWIDSEFATWFVEQTKPLAGASIRVLMRPTNGCNDSFVDHQRQACAMFQAAGMEVRESARLHAKVVLIDASAAWLGSTNWYKYSLANQQETIVRIEGPEIPKLARQVESWWSASNEATQVPASIVMPPTVGYDREIVDPVAQKILDNVPGAFVIGKRKSGN